MEIWNLKTMKRIAKIKNKGHHIIRESLERNLYFSGGIGSDIIKAWKI